MESCICSCCFKQSFEIAECMNMEWRKLSYRSVSVIAQQRSSDVVGYKCTKSYWPQCFSANCEFRSVCEQYIESILRHRICCRTFLYAARHALRQKGFSSSNCKKMWEVHVAFLWQSIKKFCWSRESVSHSGKISVLLSLWSRSELQPCRHKQHDSITAEHSV
jgi:hypothetical protein